MKSFAMKALVASLLFVGLAVQSASAQVSGGIEPYPGHGGIQPYPGSDYPGDYRPGRPGRPGNDHGYSEINRQQAKRIARMLYQGILFRNADPQGLQHHARHIEMYGVNGLIDSAYAMASSEEFRRNIQPRYNAKTIVNNMYRAFFNRPADYGSQGWVYAVREGRAGEAAAGIVESEEFLNRHVYTGY